MATNHRICSVLDCERKYLKNGMCNMHALRWKKTGSTELVPRPTLAQRFWEKVEKRGPADCWPWTGSTNKKGYGKIISGGRLIGAHVVSYELHYGELPSGIEVDHECHNVICVNPKHLRRATRMQNSQYMNGPQVDNKLGVRGVIYDQERRKYRASVYHDGKRVMQKRFDTLEEADAAVRAKRAELFTFPEAN